MIELVWNVSKAGYFWGKSGDPTLLTMADMGVRRCSPLDEDPLLFRRFGELQPWPEAFHDFADAYGHLTAGVKVAGQGDRDFMSSLAYGTWAEWDSAPPETLALWRLHHERLREAVRLWDAMPSPEALPAPEELGREIEWGLRGGVRLGFNTSRQLVYRPRDLITGIWLQFALAVEENPAHRRCVCGNWFILDPEGASRKGRRDKIFCSDKCRMRAAYEQRRARESLRRRRGK